ncbi:NAD(P)-dependent alcohol dehydrogenase [Microbacterium karelineae]|uniref:NAD(P)-dependent alcohol dehydrogenase n=1 Tax=Microbacterium karelineae TaxID=2654283 RepID=UPI0012EA5777|nr:NAD(P)-dependent alcohol dehydrogenase [Microbacterium karelineae]
MRAVVRDAYGGSEVLRVDEVPDPAPGPGEVLVRVRASSLNMADLDILLGRPRVARVFFGIASPRTPGMGVDLAGEVEEVGADVTGLRRGDHVWADVFDHGHSALAERAVAPADALRRIPDGVSFVDAAAVPHSGLLALQVLRSTGSTRPGERVLVIGGGGCVGPFAIQLAKAAGAHVTGVDTGAKAALMREAGADDTIDFTVDDVTRGGRRFDVVIDIADAHGLLPLRRLLARRGRYSLLARRLGSYAEKALLGPVVGATIGARMGTFAWRANSAHQLDEVGRLLAAGAVRPVIDGVHGLDAVPEMFARLAAGDNRGKIVIEP